MGASVVEDRVWAGGIGAGSYRLRRRRRVRWLGLESTGAGEHIGVRMGRSDGVGVGVGRSDGVGVGVGRSGDEWERVWWWRMGSRRQQHDDAVPTIGTGMAARWC
ncbi:hypothetical protein M0R45_019674 [Rubus argutus]|uniref:Uncharacterized protein n=1 Tax=Rubus argutus TaxID=59490 RepID=A0AAW1X856_RUBAR